jgi:hypothetical protein
MLPPMADEGRASEKPAPAKAAPQEASRAQVPPSEAAIDSPQWKTLFLMFVVFAVTAGSWGAARFACNMHPPESRGAPKLPTERFMTTAKDAGIELVQRWRSYDFTGAMEIASGDLVQELGKEKSDCEAQANECARKREASAGRLTTAVTLAQDGFNADVRVTTVLKGKTEVYRLRTARRESMLWHVVSKSLESGG